MASSKNFTIQDLQSDFMIEDVLLNVLEQFHQLNLARLRGEIEPCAFCYAPMRKGDGCCDDCYEKYK
jgi:hypothetical protein